MKTLTPGKLRGLQRCATQRGAIAVLALDHRNNLRRALHPDNPEVTTADELSALKQEITRAVSPVATATLLDPEFGAAQCVAAGALPRDVGLIVSLEATGYTGDPAARQSRILPGWSVAKAKRMGADAVKLLVYYHPQASTADAIEALVREVASACAAQDLTLFLEVLTYAPDPTQRKLTGDARHQAIIEAARRLTPLGCDALKAEFPLDITAEPDEHAWAEACTALTQASAVPWVLLSAGVSYETYLRQVTVACQAGASGVAVGRAVWKEATSLAGKARTAFLSEVARERMARVTALCHALARPWTAIYAPEPVSEDWYRIYGGPENG